MRLDPDLALVASRQFGLSGPFDCHVYALRGPGGVVLVDAGSGLADEALLARLERDLGPARPDAIVLTHSHPDHAAGAASLRARTGCLVYAPAPAAPIIEAGDEEASGLARARELGLYPEELRMRPCPVTGAFHHGERFRVCGIEFGAIHVRGHSEDSFCLLCELSVGRALFAGDVVFYGGVLGLINAPGSSLEGYRSDFGRLAGLAADALLPGHGLFTLRGGQRHIDCAAEQLRRGFLPRMIGQGDLIF
jgi:glyoxylase-like metal-dependent hydrolase (beta-lactamase superfamily II)